MGEITFYLPGFFNKFELNITICDWMKERPEFFYPNIKIGAVYGSFPNAIWNGGRVVLGGADREDIENVVQSFNDRGIAIRYTFTNPLIQPKHLNDTFCNICMEVGDNGMNEVIINSPLLEAYIRKNYPQYRLISSTTKCLNKMESIKEELDKDYALIVIDNSFNNTGELWKLTPKERCELLINSYCRDNCPNRAKHYEEIAKAQLEFRSSHFPECSYIKKPLKQQMKKQSFITVEKLYGEYSKAGFTHFKIDGRTLEDEKLIESYLYYLVKPEYRKKVKEGLRYFLKGTNREE